jgi:Arc/MetJ-type ribon-helix-helix transcriptional regulator
MSSELSPELNRRIAQEMALGQYSSEEELLADAMRLLHERNALRQQIAAGARQLNAGEYTDYDSAGLRQRFDQLKAENAD